MLTYMIVALSAALCLAGIGARLAAVAHRPGRHAVPTCEPTPLDTLLDGPRRRVSTPDQEAA